jgi:hypothetical protein
VAIITMTIDHIGAVLLPDQIAFRIIGRIAFPLFSYLLALGMDSSRTPVHYFLRLMAFALLSQIPYSLAFGRPPFQMLNIFFTLAFSLLTLWKPVLALPSLFLSEFLRFDYGAYGIVVTICMQILKRHQAKGLLAFGILNIAYMFMYDIQLFSLLALPFILVYQHGSQKRQPESASDFKYPQWRQYFFYFYYPIHLSLLHLVSTYVST